VLGSAPAEGRRLTLRRLLALSAVLGVLLAACAPEETEPTAGPTGESPAADACAKENLNLLTPGQLTIGTDNPAFPPWFGGGTPEGSPWEFNDPSTGKGYESAVAYGVAEGLGFAPEEVEWVEVPFNQSFRPGAKDFDFFINQVSYTSQRDQAVDFSDSYYDTSQALVAVGGTPIADATTVADLKPYALGAPIGTTSFDVIEDEVQPDEDPAVFDTLNDAIQALKNGQVDGIVADVPTAFIIIAVSVDGGVIVGQFPTTGEQEYFGMVFEDGNPLRECVNQALSELRSDGTLDALEERWIAEKGQAPLLG
jgi:polar amino acid transport system substrate-binding protein